MGVLSTAPPTLVERRRVIVVMDLAGFTRAVSALGAMELAELVHDFYDVAAATVEAHGGVVVKFVGVAAFGAGFALIFPALMAFTVDRVPDHERGEALGSFTAFMDAGSGGGAYLIGAIADAAGFGWAYGTPAMLCVAGAGLLLVLAARSRQTVGALRADGGSIGAEPRRGFVARQ